MEQEFSLYQNIGGDTTLRSMIDAFYELVYQHPIINRLFVGDITVIKEKQRLFLTQFLGGPTLYTEIHGHPRMRARHLPHTITQTDASAWLECMHKAIDTLDISNELKLELFNRFPKTAFFMVNS